MVAKDQLRGREHLQHTAAGRPISEASLKRGEEVAVHAQQSVEHTVVENPEGRAPRRIPMAEAQDSPSDVLQDLEESLRPEVR